MKSPRAFRGYLPTFVSHIYCVVWQKKKKYLATVTTTPAATRKQPNNWLNLYFLLRNIYESPSCQTRKLCKDYRYTKLTCHSTFPWKLRKKNPNTPFPRLKQAPGMGAETERISNVQHKHPHTQQTHALIPNSLSVKCLLFPRLKLRLGY